jgi:O-antigen/teichoic acid export membrane protein
MSERIPPRQLQRLHVRDLGPLAAGRLVQALGGLAATRILTEYLLPKEVGTLAEIGIIAAAFNLMGAVPVWQYCLRAFNTWLRLGSWEGELKRFLGCMTALAICGGIGVWLVQWRFGLVAEVSASVLGVLVGLNVLFTPAYTAGSTALNLIHRRISFVLFSNAPVWIGLGCSLLLILRRQSAGAWYLGQDLGYMAGALSLILLWRILRAENPTGLKRAEGIDGFGLRWHLVFPFAWPICFRALIWWFQSQGNRVLLAWLAGPGDLGMFTVSYGLAATPLTMAEQALQQLYEPQFYADLARGSDRAHLACAWERFAAVYIPALLLVGCYVGASGPLLARLLLGPRFRVVGLYAAIPAVAETLRGVNAMFTNLAVAKMDMKVAIMPVVAGAVATLAATALFVPRWSFVGALWGAAVGTAVVFIVCVLKTASVLPVRWPWRKMGGALALALPVVVAFVVLAWAARPPSILTVVAALLGGGLYSLACLAVLIERGLRSSAMPAAEGS